MHILAGLFLIAVLVAVFSVCFAFVLTKPRRSA
jgi:hypothetical protein